MWRTKTKGKKDHQDWIKLTNFLSFSLFQLLSIHRVKENIPVSPEMLCQQKLLLLVWYNFCLTNQGEIYHTGHGGVVYRVISRMALSSQKTVVLFRRWNAAAVWEMNEGQNWNYKRGFNLRQFCSKNFMDVLVELFIYLFTYLFFPNNEKVLETIKW